MSTLTRKPTGLGLTPSKTPSLGALAPLVKRQKLTEEDEAAWHAEQAEQKRQNGLHRATWPRKPCKSYDPNADKIGTHTYEPKLLTKCQGEALMEAISADGQTNRSLFFA